MQPLTHSISSHSSLSSTLILFILVQPVRSLSDLLAYDIVI